MSFTELSSLLTHTTAAPVNQATEAAEKALMTDLGTDIGAPFQLYIKSNGNIGGTGTMHLTSGVDMNVSNKISADEAREIGNNVHRILKHYLGTNYVVNHISQVKLNVVLKTPPP